MADFEVAKNILAVAEGLKNNFPGGWKNIRSLAIKTATSISLPVFFSLGIIRELFCHIVYKSELDYLSDAVSKEEL